MFLLLTALLTAALPKGLVDVKSVAPTVVVDLSFSGKFNMLGKKVYKNKKCYVKPEIAQRLAAVEAEVQSKGFHLVLWECYRSEVTQKAMWATCTEHHSESHCETLLKNPAKGKSGYETGMTVDVGLVSATGRPVFIPSKHNSGLFPQDGRVDLERAARPQKGKRPKLWPEQAFRNYQVLEAAMLRQKFIPAKSEWWHWWG